MNTCRCSPSPCSWGRRRTSRCPPTEANRRRILQAATCAVELKCGGIHRVADFDPERICQSALLRPGQLDLDARTALPVFERVGQHLLGNPVSDLFQFGREWTRLTELIDDHFAPAALRNTAQQVLQPYGVRPALSGVSTWRTSCNDVRAELAIFAIVSFSLVVS